MAKEAYDILIIGSGLGGLACGYILAGSGRKVCVLERNAQAGGCLQTFRRGDMRFDTGFHYVGGLDEGQPLHRLFRYFGRLDLPWRRMDETAFDEVGINGRTYAFANGYNRFVDTLAQAFPRQRRALAAYAAFLEQVGDRIFDVLEQRERENVFTGPLFTRPAYRFLNETIDDPLLRRVLSGTSLKMDLQAATLPLYVFAQINSTFIQSAWRLQGGGGLIAERLAQHIREMGGEVRTRAEVTRLTESGGRLSAVEVNGEERLTAAWVISDVHPAYTLSLIDETKYIRKIYRNRIVSLENTFGMFTANLRLKPDSLPYRNRNLHLHDAEVDLWHYVPGEKAPKAMMASYYVPEDSGCFAPAVDLLTPMSWSEVSPWKDLPAGRRGEAYEQLKLRRAEMCIDRAAAQIPGLRDRIDAVYTSTPLTYHSWLKGSEGSAYGIRKDCNRPILTLLTPRTPLANLLPTGQNLNLHGVLGVSVTAFFICAEILGWDTVRKLIRD